MTVATPRQAGEVDVGRMVVERDVLGSTGTRNGYLWATSTWRQRRLLEGHSASVRSITFSPDGARVVTTSADSSSRLYRVSDGDLLFTIGTQSHTVTSAAWAPDGGALVTGSLDKTARVWSQQSTRGASFVGHTDGVTAVAYSPDGSRVLTASIDGTARLWEPTGEPLLAGARAARGRSDGGRVQPGWDTRPERWRRRTCASLAARRGAGLDDRTRHAGDSRRLDDRWARADGERGRRCATLSAHGRDAGDVPARRADPRRRGDGGRGGCRDKRRGRRRPALAGQRNRTRDAAPGWRDHVGRVQSGRATRSCDVNRGQRPHLARLGRASCPGVRGGGRARSPPRGRRTGGWSQPGGRHARARVERGLGPGLACPRRSRQRDHVSPLSPDGRQLLTADRGGDARTWDVAKGIQAAVFKAHVSTVSDARFSADGRWVVTAGPRASGLWQARDGELPVLHARPRGAVDGRLVLTRRPLDRHGRHRWDGAALPVRDLRRRQGARRGRETTRPRAPRLASDSLLELVRLARQRGEAGLEEVVRARRRERPRQQPPEARREDLRASASPAAVHVPMQRVHVTSSPIACCMPPSWTGARPALVRVPLDERLAHEARHLVVGDRPRRLVARSASTAKSSVVWLSGGRDRPTVRSFRRPRDRRTNVAMIAAYDRYGGASCVVDIGRYA